MNGRDQEVVEWLAGRKQNDIVLAGTMECYERSGDARQTINMAVRLRIFADRTADDLDRHVLLAAHSWIWYDVG